MERHARIGFKREPIRERVGRTGLIFDSPTREIKYEYAARVIKKEHNPDLGDAVRDEVLDADESENRDWDLLVFFDGFVSVSVSGDKIADLFDYGNRFPVRFIRVTNERLEALEAEYGDIDGFINSIKE